jgi:hypothetical protein
MEYIVPVGIFGSGILASYLVQVVKKINKNRKIRKNAYRSRKKVLRSLAKNSETETDGGSFTERSISSKDAIASITPIPVPQLIQAPIKSQSKEVFEVLSSLTFYGFSFQFCLF